MHGQCELSSVGGDGRKPHVAWMLRVIVTGLTEKAMAQ